MSILNILTSTLKKEQEQQTVHANVGLPCISNQFCRGRGQTVEHTPHGRPCHTLHIPSPRLVAGTSAHPEEGKGGGDRGITIMHITKQLSEERMI